MQLTSKFNLGQEVWYLGKTQPTIQIPCEFCAATGRITGANNEEIKCPVCHGKKRKSKRQPRIWAIRGSGHITQIKVLVDAANALMEYILDEPGAIDYYDKCPMCGYGGCDNGLMFDGAKLFATEEEAQVVCDERNKEGKE